MTAWHSTAGHREVLSWVADEYRPESFLEIGVQDGGSLRAVLSAHHPARLALCDDWGRAYGGTGRGSHDHIAALLAELAFHGTVTWLDGRSDERLPDLSGKQYDMAHVDGDHSAPGALYDLVEAGRLLRPGGVIVIHDTQFQPVARAVFLFNRLFRAPYREFSGDTGTGVWFAGVAP